MKKLRWIGLVVGIWGLLWTTPTLAIDISIVPVSQTVDVGDPVSVDVVVSGLEAGILDEIVSSFDLNITYAAAIVMATGVTYGTDLGPVSLQSTPDLTTPGLVANLIEVSLELDDDLAAQQGDSVTLLTINFTALAVGISPVRIDFNFPQEVVGRNALVLNLNVNNGQIIVGTQDVPEPGTVVLLGSGVLGLFGYGWWRRKYAV